MPKAGANDFQRGLEQIHSQLQANRRSKELTSDGSVHPYFAFRPFPKGSRCKGFVGDEDPPMDQIEFLTSEADQQGFFAANRCLAGETVVSTDGRTIRELVESGVKEFECVSWDGEKFVRARAVNPFLKGRDRLYEVRLRTGHRFRATAAHRVLGDRTWTSVSEMLRAFERGLPVSISGTGLSVRAEDGPRSTETPSGSRDDCRSECRSRDERLPLAQGVVRASFPRRERVREHGCSCALADDRGSTPSRTHRHPLHDRHPIPDGPGLRADLGAESSGRAFDIESRSSLATLPCAPRRAPASNSEPRSAREAVLHPTDVAVGLSAWRAPHIEVISIVPSDVDCYYDFSVPGLWNYVAAGVVHHNCGKTLSGDWKQVTMIRGRDPLRPLWRPKKKLERPFLVWHLVDPKKTRSALMDFVRMIPPDMPHRVYTAKGEERVEFHPSQLRPYGAVSRVLSNMLPVTEYQRDEVDWLRIDEIVRNEAMDELDQRTLSSGGQTVFTATLLREQRQLWHRFEKFDPKYRCAQNGPLAFFMASQYANPRLSFEEIEKRAKRLTPALRKIRVLGEVALLDGSAFFDGSAIEWIVNNDRKHPELSINFYGDGIPELAPWDGDSVSIYWAVWAEPDPYATYVIGADVAMGNGDFSDDCDFSAAYVYCAQTGEMVARFHSNSIKPIDFAQELMFAARYYNDAVIAPESNAGYGSTVIDQLQKFGYPHLYQRETFVGKADRTTNCYGWNTSQPSKYRAALDMQKAIALRMRGEGGGVVIHDEELLSEMREFGILSEPRRGAYGLGALDGHDDLVMAALITLQAAKQAREPDFGGKRTFAFGHVFESWQKEALNRKMGVVPMEHGGNDDG